MILHLMLSSLLNATLMTLAAVTAEAGLRAYGRPARWIWMLVLVGSIGLPFLDVVAPDLELVRAGGSAVGKLVTGPEPLVLPSVVASIAAPQPWSARLDAPLTAVWCTATVGLLFLFLATVYRLARERRAWQRVRLGGVTAWLSGDVGPAVVGIAASSIVVPAWVLELDGGFQRLIAIHEGEHLRAGDLRIMIAGLLLVLLAPWNPLLWWQLRRLRLAVEVDCDGRVLRRGVGVMAYSSLLLEVGGRSARHHLPALAFLKKTSTLARRIHLMTWKPRMRFGRAVGAAALAITFAALACETTTVSIVSTEAAEAELVAEGTDTSSVAVQELVSGRDAPLYVLDGVIVAREAIEDIDPRAIESIEVIKGGAAQGLYGERAADGVVVITTGQGKPEAVSIVEMETPEAQHVAERADSTDAIVRRPDAVVVFRSEGASEVEQPLYVIDGVIVTRAPIDLDSLDIDRIEVVKGSTAQELYGERGANGVVIITTKKGDGAEGGKPQPSAERW